MTPYRALHRPAVLTLASCILATTPAFAQAVVVDQGQFAVEVAGHPPGTEDFALRRAGLGSDDSVIANGVIAIDPSGDGWEIRPLLRALPSDGSAESYQVAVAGRDAIDIAIRLNGRRFLATIRSAVGDEDREFQARPGTRIVEKGVAHHYYFLRDEPEGRATPVLEPRSRRQLTLSVASRQDVELLVGANTVAARRVEFTSSDGDHRTVWFDRQGRVLRVEIPSESYVAVRTDTVG